MFRTKDFNAIVNSQIAHMEVTQDSLTDFRVGSVIRTLVEASAIEMDEFYQRVLYGLLEAIPVAVYNAFGFEPIPATAATGLVRFESLAPVANEVYIPSGTAVKTDDGRRFYTLDHATITPGLSYIDARVKSATTGEEGNLPSRLVTSLDGDVPGVERVSNLEPLAGGRNVETPAALKLRFIGYIASLSRGTIVACEYAAKNAIIRDADGVIIEYVKRVGVSEMAGSAKIYLYSSWGIPSNSLLTLAQMAIDGFTDEFGVRTPGYRPIGVQVEVVSMVEREVNVTLHVDLLPTIIGTDTLKAQIQDAISELIRDIPSDDILYVEDIIATALAVPGVQRVLIENDANIPCALNEVLVLGQFSATWME